MANISDPYVFLVPLYRFESDGTFLAAVPPKTLDPNALFGCEVLEELGNKLPSHSKGHNGIAYRISLPESPSSIVCVCDEDLEMPLFWRVQLFNDQGLACNESPYLHLWRHKRLANLMYVACQGRGWSFAILTCGHLIDVAIFLALFEADDREGQKLITQVLDSQKVRDIVCRNWDRLQVDISITPGLRNGSFTDQLSKEHDATVQFFDVLVQKRRKWFARLFAGQ